MFKSTRKFALPFLLISLTSGNLSVLASLCAGFPFVFPVLYNVSGISRNRIVQSASLGLVGITISVILMCALGIYSIKSWLVPALAGFSMCNIYFRAFIKAPEGKYAVLKFVSVLPVILTCMYIR